MLDKIREYFDIEIPELSNIVEMDETLYGGKNKNRHWNKKIKFWR